MDWQPAKQPTTPVLYVATARGVYQSADLGVSWSRFGEGLPNSPVTDLQLATIAGQGVLAASTYGRGAWEIDLGAINRVWSGGSGTTANWSDTNNWADHTVPVAGDNVIFPAAASRMSNTNNLTANLQLGNIVFQTGGYTVSGSAIDLGGSIDGSASAGNTAFNLGVTLTGASSVLNGGTGSDITLGQPIDTNGFGLSVGGGTGRADFTANVSGGGGLTVADSGGSVRLSGTNAYSGGTTLTAGTLIVLNPAALLSGSNLTVGAYAASAFGLPLPAPVVPDAATSTASRPAIPTASSVSNRIGTIAAVRTPVNVATADAIYRQATGPRTRGAAIARRAAGELAWLVPGVGFPWPDDSKRKDVSHLALDALMAAYRS